MANEKIRILMVGPDRGVHGGISAVINNYYEAGLDSMVDLKYIGTMREGSRGKKLFIAAAAYLKFLFALGNCDIVHVNASSDNSIMRKSFFIRAAYRHNKKIVLHQHGGDFKNYFENQISDKRREYLRNILDMSDVMLVLTSSWKEYFSGITDAGKIRVFPNCVSVKKEMDAGRVDFGAGRDMNRILFLGRVCKDKGIDELLTAVSEIGSVNKDVKLCIGGIYEDENYRSKIEGSKNVQFLGWISGKEKERYLRECGVFVLPSYYEGLPVSVLEAMAAGCVVVASEVGGIPDVVTDGVNGILVPPKDTEALKNALLRVMDDDSYADKLRVSAYEKVRDNYSSSASVEKLVNIYTSLL